MLIADAHLDLAYNALRGRDVLRPAAEQARRGGHPNRRIARPPRGQGGANLCHRLLHPGGERSPGLPHPGRGLRHRRGAARVVSPALRGGTLPSRSHFRRSPDRCGWPPHRKRRPDRTGPVDGRRRPAADAGRPARLVRRRPADRRPRVEADPLRRRHRARRGRSRPRASSSSATSTASASSTTRRTWPRNRSGNCST